MESDHGQVLPGTSARLLLRSRLGAMTLALLCAVQFLDIADSAIVNVALPSIQHRLGFSQQNLQWVASGYILTYGGFLLLGSRLGDLLGRRRMLLAGLAVFAVSSLTAGLATSAGLLVAARLVQGTGAALMAPAALRHPPREGPGRGRPDPADRVYRVLLHVLLRDAVHAGDSPLLTPQGGRRLSPDHRGIRYRRRPGVATGHAHRHPARWW